MGRSRGAEIRQGETQERGKMEGGGIKGLQFTTYFQPIVHLETNAVAGFEALARVIGPDGSVQEPGNIIEGIEKDVDLFNDLMWTILSTIQRTMVPLFESFSGFYVSFNMPPAAVGTESRIDAMLEELGLTRYLGRLVIEITERQALSEEGRSALQLGRRYGVGVAVDDFGTGHSGLAQIAGFDLDILKIDHSLIAPVLTNRTSARLLRGIVALAGALRIRTIAEGVETWEQAFFLKAAGVDCGQGWFWSKALPAEDVEGVLRKGFGSVLGSRQSLPAE
jgi:EAL domain-containing protein (putative c-di-GMP-specific phosphodiesterase class I)